MSNFIEIKNNIGETVIINTSAIVSIVPLGDGTRINFTHHVIGMRDYLEIRVPCSEVLAKVNGCTEIPIIEYKV